MLLRKKVNSLIVTSIVIMGLSCTTIVNADNSLEKIEDSSTSLQQIETRSTIHTGTFTKSLNGTMYTAQAYVLTKPSTGQAAAKATMTAPGPKPAKHMGFSTSLFGTNYALITSTPITYNTANTSAITVSTRYADGYSTFTTSCEMRVKNSNGTYTSWSSRQSKWVSPFSRDIDIDSNSENVFENYQDILRTIDISSEQRRERQKMYSEKGMILAKANNGKEGYVYEDEVRKDSSEERTINVYNKDGKVIGDFTIAFGEEE